MKKKEATKKPAVKRASKKGGAPKGNKFWKARSSHGRKPIFNNPDDLWAACCEYFDWVDKHPLTSAELIKYQGSAKIKRVPKMRAMTISGLCLFLNISRETWFAYGKKGKGFSDICKKAEEIIRTQKFEGAAADLLNANIIARDLGLADKQQKEHTGPGGGPIPWYGGPNRDLTIEEWEKQFAEQDSSE